MRKILLLLCIISITFSAEAQLFSKHWNEGSFYDLNGVKHSGLIAWVPPQPSFLTGAGDEIFFKKGKNGKEIKIKTDSLKSFVRHIDAETSDSLVVSSNKLFEKKPFLKVVVDHLPKLYASITIKRSATTRIGAIGPVSLGVGFSYDKTIYYYGADPDNVTRLDKKNFIEIMSTVMADKPETVERIKSKRLRLGDMEDLLYFYKYGLMPPAPAPDPFSGPDH